MLYDRLVEVHLHNDTSVFEDDQHHFTYAQIHEKTMRFSAYLTGLRLTGTVVIVSNNSMASCIAILSSIACGLCYSVVHDTILEDRKRHILKNSDACLIIGENPSWAAETDVPFLSHHAIWNADECPSYVRELVPDEANAYILYTSGSTAHPKGVLAAQKQVIFSVTAINSVLKNTRADRIWNCLPLSFDYGMYQLFLALDSEASFYISNQPIIPMIPHILSEKKITGFPVVPSMLGMMLRSRLLPRISGISLRYICSTGDALPVEWIIETEKTLPGTIVVPMYGITECKRVAIMPLEDTRKKYAGSCGLPLPGIDICIDRKGSEDFGELVVYGPNVMKGYWKDPEGSRACFGFDPERNQPFLRTGDIFRIDEDGYLYFVGRKSQFIKCNGYRISGNEIDAHLMQTVHGVLECCTIGIPHSQMGQQIVTIISGAPDQNELNRSINQLPQYMRPHRLILQELPLPKNANGKIDKRKIREIVM